MTKESAVDAQLLHWTGELTGLDRARVQDAYDRLATWNIAHLESELRARTADAAVATVLLVEGVEHLESAGIPHTKLLAKLRGDRQIWPSWGRVANR